MTGLNMTLQIGTTRLYLLFIVALLLATACSKDEPLNNSPVADFAFNEILDELFLYDRSYDPDGDQLTYRWSINPATVLLSNTERPNVYFQIPMLENPKDITVSLTVSDGKAESEIQKTLTLPVLNQVRSYGLGMHCTSEKSNNVGYKWYIDQAHTGPLSNINCGPAAATMAIKWADSTFTRTAEEARNMYPSGGGWWYTSTIINYLNYSGVGNYVLGLSGLNVLTREIDHGNIVILCLDMYFISNHQRNRWRVDKFYHTGNSGWGHFIVVKGYKLVDDKLFLEAYDPYGFGQTYDDGSPKGLDRYYRGEDIQQSASLWWNYAIIVTRDPAKTQPGLDVSAIPHKWGG